MKTIEFRAGNYSSLSLIVSYKRLSSIMSFVFYSKAAMDYPTLSSLCDRPAKRQCWSSYDLEDNSNLQSYHQQFPDFVAIEFEVS